MRQLIKASMMQLTALFKKWEADRRIYDLYNGNRVLRFNYLPWFMVIEAAKASIGDKLDACRYAPRAFINYWVTLHGIPEPTPEQLSHAEFRLWTATMIDKNQPTDLYFQVKKVYDDFIETKAKTAKDGHFLSFLKGIIPC